MWRTKSFSRSSSLSKSQLNAYDGHETSFLSFVKNFRFASHYLSLKSEPYNRDQNTIDSRMK